MREECLLPEGADETNHRWEQSALSLIAHQVNQVRLLGAKPHASICAAQTRHEASLV
jgi:hypothetical protein